MTASIMSHCDFESSQISAQDTLLASYHECDDIMYHILAVNMFYYGRVLFTGLKHANIKGVR